MLQYFETLTDLSGNALYQATVTVTVYPGGAAATIYSTNGTANPIANNTVSSDITGQVSFYIPDGAYILTYTYQGTQYKVKSPVQMIDPMAFTAITDTGAVNAYVISDQRLPANLYTGLKAEILIGNTNTGASTLNVNSTGAQPFQQPGGAALASGMVQKAGLSRVEWDGTRWQLLGSQSQPFYAASAAEIAANVTIVSNSYPVLNVLRYGADPTNTNDSTTAFNAAISVMLEQGGGTIFLPTGTYKISSSLIFNLAPSSGPSATTYGCRIDAYTAAISFTGLSGYAIDVGATGTSATYASPMLSIQGLNVLCTAAAAGGIRQRSINMARYRDVFVLGATNGCGFALYNDQNWDENNRYEGCGVINCQDGMQFQSPTGSGTNSYARTHVDQFFGAGISRYWFWIQGGCSVYDSRFRHICGNFGSNAYFAIGTSSASAADMTSTDIDGIYTEINGTVTNQTLMLLLDYPQNSGTERRPKLYNVGAYAQYTGSGYINTWSELSGGSYVAVNVESAQLQTLNLDVPIAAGYGQSTAYESVTSATEDIATEDSSLPTVDITGCSSTVSGRLECNRTGNQVTLMAYDALTGTSNADTMTLTGLPSEFWPSTARVVKVLLENNSATADGLAIVGTSGTITFSLMTAVNTYSATGFTASGTKGLPVGYSFTYSIGA